MEQAILDFNKQFGFIPEIQNRDNFKPSKNIILAGMGGSHLAGGIIKDVLPFSNLYIHWDYGIPAIPKESLENSLLVASSYSGNTEEVLEFAEKAIENKYNLICIAVGGKLLDLAKENNIPYIKVPDTGIQPRSALGFSMIAIAHACGFDSLLPELAFLKDKINPLDFKGQGEEMSEVLFGCIPVIYSSRDYGSVAYNWKIKMNETGKIPAFYNLFPELNHNEMQGMDRIDSNKSLTEKFHFVFLEGPDIHPRIKKRMEVAEKLYQDRGMPVTHRFLDGESKLERIFRSLLIADWTALNLSKKYGTEAEKVPMIEEFKGLIQ